MDESRASHGPNVLTPPVREPWWQLYREKFDDPVIRILLVAAAVSIVVGVAEGHFAEGIGIILAVLLATGLAFWNEYRAAKEFDLLSTVDDEIPVTVIRTGTYVDIPRKDLVVGDVVQVEVGEEIPADGRVLESVNLSVTEARLTGESRPVEKGPLPGDGSAAYAGNVVLRGSTVSDGYGLVEITAVGDATEIGQTARAASERTAGDTPLNRQLTSLSRVIGVVGLVVAVLTFAALIVRGVVKGEMELTPGGWVVAAAFVTGLAVGLVRVWLPIVCDGFELLGRKVVLPKWFAAEGFGPWLRMIGAGTGLGLAILAIGILAGIVPADPEHWLSRSAVKGLLSAFMVAVTLVVVAVPEGLAMSVTLSLAYGMRKMAATNTLVRRLHAVETIGATSVICSDKTGTLTTNEMRVAGARVPETVEGMTLLSEAIAANSTANLSRLPGEPVVPVGNPTEAALLLWLDQRGIDYAPVRTAFRVSQQWTFTTERKLMATRGDSAVLNGPVLYVKGAPEVVLDRCHRVFTGAGPVPIAGSLEGIRAELSAAQSCGQRTLGLAYQVAPPIGDLDASAVGLTWLGFFSVDDPVREEVPAAIRNCRAAGIAVKLVTGDSSRTATEVARSVGMDVSPDRHLTGPQFAALPDDRASEAAETITILSRARPADKLRLVSLLKKRGDVVAVTGDGVNDGPALNHADVGLAMGKSGTAVAKEASDVILLDDSFASVLTAIRWGRGLYENVQRFLLFQLTINVVALGLAFLGPFVGVKLPLTVMQMLWVNLIMDTFAALALATEPPHPNVLARPPRKAGAFIVTRPMAVILFGTAALFLSLLIGFVFFLQSVGLDPDTDAASRGGTLLFSAFVLLQFWNMFNARAFGRGGSALGGLAANPWFALIAAAILSGQFLIVQLGGGVFRTTPLSLNDWAWLVGLTSLVLLGGEVVRFTISLRRRTGADFFPSASTPPSTSGSPPPG